VSVPPSLSFSCDDAGVEFGVERGWVSVYICGYRRIETGGGIVCLVS
jgi:hypothetical protein